MDFNSNQTIVSQIVSHVKKQIFSGKLAPGEKILPIREQAAYCSVNPNTITKAYAVLEAEKLIYTDSTLGKFVSQNVAYLQAKRKEYLQAELAVFRRSLQACGVSQQEFLDLVVEEGMLCLADTKSVKNTAKNKFYTT